MDWSRFEPTPGGKARFVQLADWIERAITAGRLAAGDRLPPERLLGAQLGSSRTTVAQAYEELKARGLARGHVGRGTFVTASPEAQEAPFAWRGKVSSLVATAGDPELSELFQDLARAEIISFAAGSPALECFPSEELRRTIDKILVRRGVAVLQLERSEGLSELREVLAERLSAHSSMVLAVSGSQQGIDLVARCLIQPGEPVVVDRPCFVGVLQAFRTAGARVLGWDAARCDFSELEDLILRYRPKLLYTNPTFQNPTGRVMNLGQRRDLLSLIHRHRLPVVEDCAYAELSFEGKVPPSLSAIDRSGSVISLGTFSKVLGPGLRLGWICAARSIVQQLAWLKQQLDGYSPVLMQAMVAELLRSGSYDRHLASC